MGKKHKGNEREIRDLIIDLKNEIEEEFKHDRVTDKIRKRAIMDRINRLGCEYI